MLTTSWAQLWRLLKSDYLSSFYIKYLYRNRNQSRAECQAQHVAGAKRYKSVVNAFEL